MRSSRNGTADGNKSASAGKRATDGYDAGALLGSGVSFQRERFAVALRVGAMDHGGDASLFKWPAIGVAG